MYSRLMAFLNRFNQIYSRQFGFHISDRESKLKFIKLN